MLRSQAGWFTFGMNGMRCPPRINGPTGSVLREPPSLRPDRSPPGRNQGPEVDVLVTQGRGVGAYPGPDERHGPADVPGPVHAQRREQNPVRQEEGGEAPVLERSPIHDVVPRR